MMSPFHRFLTWRTGKDGEAPKARSLSAFSKQIFGDGGDAASYNMITAKL
jgi:hypothetical protein